MDDSPYFWPNLSSTVTEGGTDTLASTELRYKDDQPATSVTYAVTGSPTHGRLELTTDPGVAVIIFTQSDSNNRIVYVHDGTPWSRLKCSYR